MKTFAQAVKSAIKELGPWPIPLMNFLHGVLKAGAAALGWLATSNLWVLVIALAWFLCDYM